MVRRGPDAEAFGAVGDGQTQGLEADGGEEREGLVLGTAVRSWHAAEIGASGAPLDYRPLMAAVIAGPRDLQVFAVNDLV
jgi:hypothetical protein